MPEGDTVLRLARRLRPALEGRLITHAQLQVPAHATADLGGSVLTEIDTHGKHLLMRTDRGLTLHTHLRLTGSWSVLGAGKHLPRRVANQVRVVLATAAATAYGLDLPVVQLLRTSDEPLAIGHLGPDPLRADWDQQRAVANVRAQPDRAVAAALLDQRTIAGLGNLWANELCFLRGLHPWRRAGDVDAEALVALAARALAISARSSGPAQVTTGNPRRDARHWVAGRAGLPCRRCGTVIRVRADEQAGEIGRRTWWCPRCQPEG